MAGRKLFVGSLPNGIEEFVLRSEFGQYGPVEDVFIKQNCDPGKQWAFITFSTAQCAQLAKEGTDRVLHFPGSERPCDVMIAKNQGLYGQEHDGQYAKQASFGEGDGHKASRLALDNSWSYEAPNATKIFVGSLPESISDGDLRAEFSKYGVISDIFLNTKPIEAGRQWAFITFASPEHALAAKASTDRLLMFQDSQNPCEVALARHQGMYGKDSLESGQASPGSHMDMDSYSQPIPSGPRKIFVGSLPSNISQQALHQEFGRYGQVIDIHLNTKACDAGRNWAFITFATPDQAAHCKDMTDRVLMMSGAEKPCEVMIAKNQGKFGQEPMSGHNGSGGHHYVGGTSYGSMSSGAKKGLRSFANRFCSGEEGPASAPVVVSMALPSAAPAQPPPPTAPPPVSLTPWRMYKTAAGLPYYHNQHTGQTQWECPLDLQVPGQTTSHIVPQLPAHPVQAQARYGPY